MMQKRHEDLELQRPEWIVPESNPETITKKSDLGAVVDGLLSGRHFLIRDEYPTGLKVMSLLRERVFGRKKDSSGTRPIVKSRKRIHKPPGKAPDHNVPYSGAIYDASSGGAAADNIAADDFATYRQKRTEYRTASNRLLVPVKENRIALKKSPAIGWLDELYPDISDFLLTYPQIQGLNSSWQWFLKGVRFPVLKHEIYPWHGTYFPTRFDHLHLIDKWLKQYSGSKAIAMDVGTGCGVLAFLLLEHGFEQVLATDINPNSVMTVRENARHRALDDRIDAHVSNLFDSSILDGYDQRMDLIVCNPPWLPSDPDSDTSLLDKAIYYDPDFFKRFFSEAASYLNENGRLVVLFSNLGRAAGVDAGHPIEDELENKRRYRKVRMMRRKVVAPSGKTRRRDHRKDEFVELWELEPQQGKPG